MGKIKAVGLCAGRHEMPVSEFLYPKVIEDPTDTQALELEALKFMRNLDSEGFDEVEVYVTGMTVALTSFVKMAADFGWISLSLFHYDSKTGSYYEQVMW